MTFICDPVHFVSVSLAVALLHCSTLCLIVAVELTHTENTHAYRIYGGDFFKPNILRVSCVFLINRLKKSECRKGIRAFVLWEGSVGLRRDCRRGGGVTSRCHVYFAFYVRILIQHTVVNIPIALPPTPPPPFSLPFPICHIIAARVLTWLDLFLTSLVGFSSPRLLLLFFFFIFSPATCCMLSVSAAEIYEVQHATTTTPCPRGASR